MPSFLFVAEEGGWFPELITADINHLSRPGSYQWYKAFASEGWKSNCKHHSSVSLQELEQYDLIHINLCGTSVPLILETKKQLKDSSVKVVINMDYPLETIEVLGSNPFQVLRCIQAADAVIAQEPSQQAALTYLLDNAFVPGIKYKFHGKHLKVPLVTHPCQTDGMKKLFVPYDDRQDRLIFCYHRYNGGALMVPGWLVQELRVKHGELIPNYCVNVVVESEALQESAKPLLLWDFTMAAQSYGNWEKFMYTLAYSTLGFSYYLIHSFDRFIVECACLGLPVVCSDLSYSGTVLYPNTCHNVLDFHGIRNSFDKLLTDEEFYQMCAKYAFERVEEYGWKPSVERYLEGIRTFGVEVSD